MLTGASEAIRRRVIPFDSSPDQAALGIIGQAGIVLLGEASHGTHEFYDIRARLTRALIASGQCQAVALEADWPDAYRIHRYVQLASDDTSAREALGDFLRFPRWMWRNHVVVSFVEWLREWNARRPLRERVSCYGLDLYSLHRSIACLLDYLGVVDPPAAQRARRRFSCFALDGDGDNPQAYGYAATLGLTPSCEREVVAQLVEMQRAASSYLAGDGQSAADEFFMAEQNARVVRDAEQYYRAMFGPPALSWNLRDEHMMGTLEALRAHVRQRSGQAGVVVWAHNSHLGDARATSMATRGELNLGQLVKTRYGSRCRSIGFTTHEGEVTATSDWEAPPIRMQVRRSLSESWEHLFHRAGIERGLLPVQDPQVADLLGVPRLERAIGVIYRPRTERASHYFVADLPRQFDAVIHVDQTSALEPLETWAAHERDLPETFPTGV